MLTTNFGRHYLPKLRIGWMPTMNFGKHCLPKQRREKPRTLNFFVKDGYKEEFPKIFEDTFKDKFLLLTHDEVMEKKLFGLGKDHEMFNDMIGDYVAIAVSNESILITHIEAERLLGGHAGLTKEEMEIPLIAVKR